MCANDHLRKVVMTPDQMRTGPEGHHRRLWSDEFHPPELRRVVTKTPMNCASFIEQLDIHGAAFFIRAFSQSGPHRYRFTSETRGSNTELLGKPSATELMQKPPTARRAHVWIVGEVSNERHGKQKSFNRESWAHDSDDSGETARSLFMARSKPCISQRIIVMRLI